MNKQGPNFEHKTKFNYLQFIGYVFGVDYQPTVIGVDGYIFN